MKNVTKGEVQIIEHSWSDTSIMVGDKTVCSISIYDEADEDTQYYLEIEATANSNLIADAFNTHNATGLTPSELKDDRDKWMEAHKASLNVDAFFMQRMVEMKQSHDHLIEQNRELVEALRNIIET